jgi:hypothetical protein
MKNGLIITVFAVVVGFLVGCAGSSKVVQQPVTLNDISKQTAMELSEKTLVAMQFGIEKYDAANGVIRTRPLRGKQFFEFWRRDNASAFDSAESNIQSIQRTIELTFAEDQKKVSISCGSSVQRLSLPEVPIQGYSTSPALYTSSDRREQRLMVTKKDRQEDPQWIDLGRDAALESKVLDQIQCAIEKGK